MAIYIGYPGVGKTTLAGRNSYVDLEAEDFLIEDKKDKNWYIPYVNVAFSLSGQGYDVFVSCQKEVRDRIKQLTKDGKQETVFTVTPDLSLEKEWVEKLKDRSQQFPTEKNNSTYKQAYNNFANDIVDILHSGFDKIIIENMTYDLEDMLYSRG